jgi:hypothetical protein
LDRTTPIIVPWYDEADFEQLKRLAEGEKRLPPDYPTWLRAAAAATERLLAEGRTVELITIRAGDYLAWLQKTGRRNSHQARLRFLERQVRAAYGDVSILRASAA